MKKQIFIIMVIIFSLVFWKVVKQEDIKEKVLSPKDMIKIRGEGGQYVGYRCQQKPQMCYEVTDICPTLPDNTPCSACTGGDIIQWCIKGSCNDICTWQEMYCGVWFTGFCNLGQCSKNEKYGILGSDCKLIDCSH